MRSDAQYLWLGIALSLVMVLVVLLLMPNGGQVALDVRRSVQRTTPDGVAAWARSVQRLGVPTAALYRSFTEVPPRGRGLVILEPDRAPTPAEVRRVLAWVRDGGVLIYSPPWEAPLADSLGLDIEFTLGREGTEPEERVPFARHHWTEGLEERRETTTWVVSADSARRNSWVPLASYEEDSVEVASLVWVPEGRGGVLVLSEAVDLSNGSLGDSPVAVVTTRVVLEHFSLGDTLFFAEYHQGIDGRAGALAAIYGVVTGSPWGRAILHASLIGVLLLALQRRFGSPLPAPEATRRSPLEHIDALARIYREAGADEIVAGRLVRGHARRLGVAGGGAEETTRALLDRCATRPGLKPYAEQALAAAERRPVDLLELSRALDGMSRAYLTSSPRHDHGRALQP